MPTRKTVLNIHRIALVTFLVGASFLHSNIFAQDSKVQVSVSHTGDDSVGRKLAFAVREVVRGSRAFYLVIPDDAGIQVRLITIDPDKPAAGNWTVATVVILMTNFIPYEKGNPQTWYPIYLGSQVLTVGQSVTDEQAKSVVAAVDAALEKYRKDSRK